MRAAPKAPSANPNDYPSYKHLFVWPPRRRKAKSYPKSRCAKSSILSLLALSLPNGSKGYSTSDVEGVLPKDVLLRIL